MDLQQKIMDSFIGKVVRKDLAFLVKGGLPVPTYVLEYLLGQYCASDDEEVITEGIEKVKQVIQNNYVHRAEAESVKGLIRESGKHRIIDKVTVVLNERMMNIRQPLPILACQESLSVPTMCAITRSC